MTPTATERIDTRRALEVARCAHSAVMDTAIVTRMAEADTPAARAALKAASDAMLYLINELERERAQAVAAEIFNADDIPR